MLALHIFWWMYKTRQKYRHFCFENESSSKLRTERLNGNPCWSVRDSWYAISLTISTACHSKAAFSLCTIEKCTRTEYNRVESTQPTKYENVWTYSVAWRKCRFVENHWETNKINKWHAFSRYILPNRNEVHSVLRSAIKIDDVQSFCNWI